MVLHGMDGGLKSRCELISFTDHSRSTPLIGRQQWRQQGEAASSVVWRNARAAAGTDCLIHTCGSLCNTAQAGRSYGVAGCNCVGEPSDQKGTMATANNRYSSQGSNWMAQCQLRALMPTQTQQAPQLQN